MKLVWFILFVAGIMEVVWATAMKASNGFTVPFYSVLTLVGMVASFLLLSHCMKTLPLGTAYAIWTGIGALGSVILGVLVYHEALSPLRALFVVLLLVGIIGLKATSGH